MSHLELVALVVRDYDAAIRFFVDVLQFELLEDTSSLTNDGRPKRWVVVRPKGGQTSMLLARADGDEQMGSIGRQFAGRVGLFLRVDDFDRPTSAWSPQACSSSRRLAMSHTADWRCFWISRGTAGTSWGETRGGKPRGGLDTNACHLLESAWCKRPGGAVILRSEEPCVYKLDHALVTD